MNTLRRALATHWPEYLIEALLLALFMISAGVAAGLLESSGSPVHAILPDPTARRVCMALAMGLTAIALIYSPMGRRSGAHFNPAVTLAFLRLGKVRRVDAAFYVLFQFVGGLAGVLVVGLFLRPLISDPSVNWVVTVPGPRGATAAFVGELAISFVLMSVVLFASSHAHLERWTGVFAGVLLASFILFESPLSGTSMNPARTFGSALPAGVWSGWWIYLAAPLAGMLAAAEMRRRLARGKGGGCAKLRHVDCEHCIFCGEENET